MLVGRRLAKQRLAGWGFSSQSAFFTLRPKRSLGGAIIAWRSEKVNQIAIRGRFDHNRIAGRLKANAPMHLATVRQ